MSESNGDTKKPKHTEFQVKCMKCGLEFKFFTWHPEQWVENPRRIHCPECGCTGAAAAFIVQKRENYDEFIFQMMGGDDVEHVALFGF